MRNYENRRWDVRYLTVRWGPECAGKIVVRRFARAAAQMSRSYAEASRAIERFVVTMAALYRASGSDSLPDSLSPDRSDGN